MAVIGAYKNIALSQNNGRSLIYKKQQLVFVKEIKKMYEQKL